MKKSKKISRSVYIGFRITPDEKKKFMKKLKKDGKKVGDVLRIAFDSYLGRE